MSSTVTYTDFLIRISGPRGQGEKLHAVEATINGDSLFFGGRLAIDEEKLVASIQDNQVYGSILREMLFSDPIERAYERAQGIAEGTTNGQLRVRLQIDPDCSALQVLRWERLALPATGREIPLSVTGHTPFSRFISRETTLSEPKLARPICMVVAISSPTNLPSGLSPIDIKQELVSLQQSLREVHTPNQLQITILPGINGIPDDLRHLLVKDGYIIQDGPISLKTLQDRLLDCDILHFLGHGTFRPGQPSGTSALFLERADGHFQLAMDDEIISHLGDGSSVPRLVFLAACESAKRSELSQEAFVGLGSKLVQAGVPAVVGMQDPVPMQLAQLLTSRFYHGLLEHGTIDQAMNDARLSLFENNSADWSIPVLFMRIRDGRLFSPDPLRTLLTKIASRSNQFFSDKEPPLPLDVIRISGDQNLESLIRLETKTTPGDDFKHAIREVVDAYKGEDPHFIVLIGGSGTAKSANMRYLEGYLAEETLNVRNPPSTIFPVYIHLANYFKLDLGFKNGFHPFILQSLQQLSPGISDNQFTNWLQDPSGPTFIFLIDGGDRLNHGERTTVIQALERFAYQHPRHCYVLVCDFSHFSGLQLRIEDYLVVKPISRPRLKIYLTKLPDKQGQDLYTMLENASLFDLASLPWMLVNILAQVRRGIIPHSRTGVLGNLEKQLLAKLPAEKNLHTRAANTLNALGWEMQRSRCIIMSVDMAFQIMGKQRGNREYLLENLLAELFDLRILSPVGDDSIRFTYPGLQAWFAAKALCSMPEQMAVLDDITATLGRLSRLRWWDDTLVLLAGRIDDPDSLLRLILYGSRITEGHQIFLAARCIHEAGSAKISEEVRRQVINTLIWLTSYANEQRARCRQQAIRALGQLKEVTAIPHLVKLILERVRTNWLGNPAFEYSSVRLTAIETLRNMVADTSLYVVEHYPQFIPLLECWSRQDVPALREHLISAPPEHQAIAAFVLGDIGSRPAAEILLEVFQQPDVEPETRWAITDALLRMEPALVTHNAILPFIDAEAAKTARIPKESWKKRKHWYDRIAYMIGNINPKTPKAESFLARCLFNYTGVWLKSRAIRAIGEIGDSHYKDLLEELAMGDFSNIAINKPRNDDITYLRNIAIGSLGSIGDQKSLSLLQQQNDGSNPELQKAYHQASEEITWRLFERSHFFTTMTSEAKYP